MHVIIMTLKKTIYYLKLIFVLIFITILIFSLIYYLKNNYNHNSAINNTITNSNTSSNALKYNTDSKDNNYFYNVYFCPENDCNSIIYNTLNNAKKIDCAIYSITLPWFYNLVKTKQTNIITDNDEIIDFAKLLDFVKTDKSKDYMHNKFCILDNNTLLIGSTNFTIDALTKQNNNFIITNNKDLILDANKYFNELLNNNFNSGFTDINFCASPNNCIQQYITQTKNAKKSIKCMQYSFTYNDLTKELIEKKKQGINIEIILEKSQNSQYSQYQLLKDNNINVIWDKNPSLMHNKFCIFDSETIITGSMNLSNNGNFNNNESIIILNNSNISNKYISYFNKYFNMWN